MLRLEEPAHLDPWVGTTGHLHLGGASSPPSETLSSPRETISQACKAAILFLSLPSFKLLNTTIRPIPLVTTYVSCHKQHDAFLPPVL